MYFFQIKPLVSLRDAQKEADKTQPAFTSSKLIMETLEKCAKSV